MFPHDCKLFRRFVAVFVLAMVFSAALTAADAKSGGRHTPSHFNIPLWEEGKAPMAAGSGPLDNPFVTAFLPSPAKDYGSAVVIAPGGSNIMLMYGAEGIDIAERFNDWGCAAFVLTYRLSPRYTDAARTADGQRALRVIRARAQEWKLDPKRIGFAGFSAGSSLARLVTASSGPGKADDADPVERFSSRPDFAVLVYGPGRARTDEQLANFPPTFLLSAAADAGAANGTAQLFLDLNRAGAVAEIHIYQKGRHGFGAATRSPEFSPWMDQLHHFLKQGGFFTSAK